MAHTPFMSFYVIGTPPEGCKVGGGGGVSTGVSAGIWVWLVQEVGLVKLHAQ